MINPSFLDFACVRQTERKLSRILGNSFLALPVVSVEELKICHLKYIYMCVYILVLSIYQHIYRY